MDLVYAAGWLAGRGATYCVSAAALLVGLLAIVAAVRRWMAPAAHTLTTPPLAVLSHDDAAAPPVRPPNKEVVGLRREDCRGRVCVVTGAGGFVGQHVVHAARQAYDTVIAVDLRHPSNGADVSGSATTATTATTATAAAEGAAASPLGRVVYVCANICDAAAMESCFAAAECVFHCAALVDTRSVAVRRRLTHGVNVEGSVTVANACIRQGVSRLVLLSTVCCVITHDQARRGVHTSSGGSDGGSDGGSSCTHSSGDHVVRTTGAPGNGWTVERHKAETGPPFSLYGSTKLLGEQAVLRANGSILAARPGVGSGARLRTIALRPHVVFGPGDPRGTHVMVAAANPPPAIAGIPRDHTHNAIYVKNLAHALMCADTALQASRTGGKCDVAGRAFFVNDVTLPSAAMTRHLIACRADGAAEPRLAVPLLALRGLARLLQLVDAAVAGTAVGRWLDRRLPLLTLLTPEGLAYASISTPIDASAAVRELGYQPLYTYAQALEEIQAYYSPSPRCVGVSGGCGCPQCGPRSPTDSLPSLAMSPTAALHRLFSPVTVRGVQLRNRFIKAATFEAMCEDGKPTEALARHHAEYAAGGVGLQVVAYGAVCRRGRTFRSQMVMDEAAVPGLRRVADAVHTHGGRVCLQLNHAGYWADRGACGMNEGPSAVLNPVGLNYPHVMTAGDIDRVAREFARAARLAVTKACFDAVQVHCAHGYLLSQFLTPYTNRRTCVSVSVVQRYLPFSTHSGSALALDGFRWWCCAVPRDSYGGCLDNRLRFPCQVIRAVRVAVGGRVPILVKLNTSDGDFAGALQLPEVRGRRGWLACTRGPTCQPFLVPA